MIIDGKKLAKSILSDCKKSVLDLKTLGITPTMAVILIGNDPGSISYVKQKEKAALEIGAELLMSRQSLDVSIQTIQNIINSNNNNPAIHGIIIQRPLPTHLKDPELLNSIDPKKDIDGFVPNTPFDVPVAKAVNKILQKMYEERNRKYDEKEYYHWLGTQQIVVIGRGETAGKPIADFLFRSQSSPVIIHNSTSKNDKHTALQQADIVISCVGKAHTVEPTYLKHGVMLISVGIWRDNEGKLHGDYEEDDVKDIASFYTPTPGGVGPVNVSCLMENLIQAAGRE
jgi:methylenetetrahydrofolate dehydrogenase (NADP+)/methenyltetrahydrofolate cyclohydrolase